MSDEIDTAEEVSPLDDEGRKAVGAVLQERISAEEKAAQAMKEAQAKAKKKELPEELVGTQVYLSPQQPNTSFLVKAGELVKFRDPNSPLGERHLRREGDLVAEFHGGVCLTNDQEVIEWLEAHGTDDAAHKAYHRAKGTSARSCGAKVGLCINAAHPMADMWVELKAGQIPLANRDATLPKGMDVDRVLSGGLPQGRIGGEGSRLMDAARRAKETKAAVAERD